MMSSSSPPTDPTLDECLKLLSGAKDEQKLAGLLLASNLSHAGDAAAIFKVYGAVGHRFHERLLITGTGKGSTAVGKGIGGNREAYLKLAVMVLAAFCSVPDIASSDEMVSKMARFLPLRKSSRYPASENGVAGFYENGVPEMLAPHISTLPGGSHSLELAMRLLQLILHKLPVPPMNTTYLYGVSCMVASLARQFAVLHNSLKFDALHLLTSILSSGNTVHSSNDPLIFMMASTICTLVLDLTSEESLLKHGSLDLSTLQSLSRIIARSLNQRREGVKEQSDLHQIVAAGYNRWADWFPIIKSIIEHGKVHNHFG